MNHTPVPSRPEPIPRIIHWCWFGHTPLPELTERCIASWKRVLPAYEIVQWNEDNFDVSQNKYALQAYTAKRWAFVSDYARAFVLARHGGIYLDADVEVRRSLDTFLVHRAFTGFECAGYPVTTAVWGAEPGHPWLVAALEHYARTEFLTESGQDLTTNTTTMKDLLVARFDINPHFDTFQLGSEGIAIYPSTTFCQASPTSFTVHHFAGSWTPQHESYRPNGEAQLALRTHALEQELRALRASTSWRITAPLRRMSQWFSRSSRQT